jgi:hypothetical protein
MKEEVRLQIKELIKKAIRNMLKAIRETPY